MNTKNKIWHDRIASISEDLRKPQSFYKPFFTGFLIAKLHTILEDENLGDLLKQKFDAGANEHKSDFATVDHGAEIQNEILDIINYAIGSLCSSGVMK